jgi:choline dehydrogenase
VGDAEWLRARGIEVIAHRPEVGRNLQDHTGLLLEWRCLKPITLYRLYRPDRAVIAVLRALLLGTGPGSIIPLEAGGMVRSGLGHDDAPDLQLTLVPGLSLATTRAGQREHGFMISVVNLRPRSEGYVAIRTSDPFDRPIIQPNYLSNSDDVFVLREGVRLARLIAAQSAFAPYRGAELSPGDTRITDSEIEAWVRSSASSAWHPTGTCRMGADDSSVVDPELRVRGVEGLRVADASIMPRIIGGNTSAPTMMIGEKAAALMLH